MRAGLLIRGLEMLATLFIDQKIVAIDARVE